MTKSVERSQAPAIEPSEVVRRRDPEEQAGLDEEDFKPLTRQAAEDLRRATPALSLWAVVLAQLGVACLLVAGAWLFTGRAVVVWSVGYGAACVVLPAVVFARGLTRQKAALQGGAALAGFAVWELVKLVLTVAMLSLAPRLIVDLNWLALLAGFVVTMKVYWVAMWFTRMPASTSKNF